MTTTNWIAIISVSAVIAGWFINSFLARRNNTVNTRIKYRVETLRKVLDIYLFIQKNKAPYTNPEFIPLLESARGSLHLFGMKNEITLFENLIKSLESNNNRRFKSDLYLLTELCLNSLRKELRLEKFPIRDKFKETE
jgi:hypothetical protein